MFHLRLFNRYIVLKVLKGPLRSRRIKTLFTDLLETRAAGPSDHPPCHKHLSRVPFQLDLSAKRFGSSGWCLRLLLHYIFHSVTGTQRFLITFTVLSNMVERNDPSHDELAASLVCIRICDFVSVSILQLYSGTKHN